MAQRFRETANIDSKLIRKIEGTELQEKLQALPAGRLVEAVKNGSPTVGWEVPISKYDIENANGRLYPKALWERVISEQQHIWRGAPMLADHPSDDSEGSPQNICGVWLEARIATDDCYVYGTFIPSGRLGEDLQDHLSKGLRAGTSSSGFGDLMRDGKTVDPASYLIERLSDWVLTPSQGTYFTYEAATRETKNASDSDRLGESANKQESVVKESTTMGGKLTKLEEKKFRKDMEAFLEDASKIEDPQGRLKEFEEILSYLHEGAVPDLREQVEAKIAEQRTEIAEILADAKKMREELGVKDTNDLKKKLTTIADDTEVLKEEANDWKQITVVLQEKLDAVREELKNRPTDAYVAHLKGKVSKLQMEKRKVTEQLDKLNEDVAAEKAANQKAVAKLTGSVAEGKAALLEQREIIETLQKSIREKNKAAKQLQADYAKLQEDYTQYKQRVDESNKVKLAPSPSTAVKKYVDFRESALIDSYWSDLLARHGEDIRPFEEKIRSCKTMREAAAVYLRVLSQLRESQEIEATRLPESVAVSMRERGELLEKAGVKVDATELTERLPKGWI